DFAVREKASQGLAKLGQRALAPLQMALDRRPALEAKQRIEVLLLNMHQTDLPKEQRRWQWAVMVLELAGTPEGRQLLHDVAKRNAGAWLAQEAEVSLKRLEKGSN